MYLKIAYLGLTLLIVIILLILGYTTNFKTFEEGLAKRKNKILLASILGWHIYIFLLAQTDILKDFSFPPRFFILMILPLFTFTAVFLRKQKDALWINHISLHSLVYYQSFRILIETIFIFSVTAKIIHPYVTFEGYNYDILFACTAPFIGYLVQKNAKKWSTLALWWNYLGLFVIGIILFLFQAVLYFPEIFNGPIINFPKEFGEYPYVLVAGFLMPSAVFIHVLTIIKIKKAKNLC